MESHLRAETIHLELFPSIPLPVCIFKRSVMLLSLGVWLEQDRFDRGNKFPFYERSDVAASLSHVHDNTPTLCPPSSCCSAAPDW